MKTRVFQFLATGLLASLVVLAALALRPHENVQSAGVPVTGNFISSIDNNNPLGLSVDPYMVPNEADSIDRQSDQYRQFLLAGSQDSRPILPIDSNNPLGLSVDPYMVPNEADSIDLQSEAYRRQFQITEPIDSRPILPIDFNNPLGLPVDPYMVPAEPTATPVLWFMDEAYRAQYQITDPVP